MPKTIFDQLLRKPIEISANGFVYRGILVEAAEKEVILRGPTGFVSIPMERIASVRDPNAKRKAEVPKFVETSFYDADLPQPDEGKKPTS